MRRLLVAAALATSLSAAMLPVMADEAKLPTEHEIYQAEEAGHYTQAQQMIAEVLKAKPDNAKAHFVQSELYARQGQYAAARGELATAERLDPEDKFTSAKALGELKAQINGERRPVPTRMVREEQRSGVAFPWKTLLILAVVVGLLMMVFRRRSPPAQYPVGGPGTGGPNGYGPPPGYGPGPGYGPAPGGGMGSGIAGGLASGLAVGAGVVAGEEIAHHFLDGGRRESSGGFIPSADAQDNPNSDMGGSDFGSSDGGSWDDGGGGGGGGDDWS